jgi:hypothetical protein
VAPMLMDSWIAPNVMGHELEIHPLLAIFTLMVGGAIGGIVGVCGGWGEVRRYLTKEAVPPTVPH